MLSLCCAALLLLPPQEPAPEPPRAADEAARVEAIRGAARLIGLELDEREARQMLGGVARNAASFRALRERELENALAPATRFHPLPPDASPRVLELPPRALELPAAKRPADLEELAFADIATLAALVRAREVSCEELAQSFLARLKRLDAELHCVISFCEERALATARARDAELAAGKWRGPLHGIPYGAKDLFAAKGAPTTWGAEPFTTQSFDEDATVIARLEAAGAVLIAKLSLGALAMGDVWFGETTRNPWNPSQGSSGSSAGSASALAAGGVVFALGTETLGSIVSPSVRCGCTALRPTFGRVSRHGAMALSWTMDKVGPMARSFGDAALVLEAIAGPDGRDGDVLPAPPFRAPASVDVRGWKVGYPADAYPEARGAILDELRALGVELVPLTWSSLAAGPLRVVLEVEAAAAFDELTRSGRDDLLKRQSPDAWPNLFRTARLVPAVEYVQAQRARTRLLAELHRRMEGLAAIVHPPFWWLLEFNLSGHPTAIAPFGERRGGAPDSIAFTGQLYDEARLLALASAWQASTSHHLRHPPRAR
ncbi:MAG: amidase [Planctomycetes bacterium]|nr:amidase [Planctomycetota bacterium]